MGVGKAAIVAEAVLAAKVAARTADSARQVGAARQPEPDRTSADCFGVVAHDRQRGCADASRHMHRPRIHAHHSLGLDGRHPPVESGWCGRADRSGCPGGCPGAVLRRHQRGNRAVAGQVVPPPDQL